MGVVVVVVTMSACMYTVCVYNYMHACIHTYIKHIFGLIQSSISKYFVNVSSHFGTGRSNFVVFALHFVSEVR